MKTLSPKDPAYRPNYVNSNDSGDKSVARGWNYHNGPEWVWPLGYFLLARLRFHKLKNSADLKAYLLNFLKPHAEHIQTSPWMGLPELTNQHAAHCPDSCTTQAWSVATLIMALDEILKI